MTSSYWLLVNFHSCFYYLFDMDGEWFYGPMVLSFLSYHSSFLLFLLFLRLQNKPALEFHKLYDVPIIKKSLVTS